MYAKELTKQRLEELGITDVVYNEDNTITVYKGIKELKQKVYNKSKGYMGINFYDKERYDAGDKTIMMILGSHVISYVWHYGIRHAGMVIDHIDNNVLNNNWKNLQELTSGDNIWKERKEIRNTMVMRMPKYITEEKILNKIALYTEQYRQAKADGDAHRCHSLRGCIAQWKSKQRLFNENPEKYKRPEPKKSVYKEKVAVFKKLKAELIKARMNFKELKLVYAPTSNQYKEAKAAWKQAIANLKEVSKKEEK